MAEPCKSTDKNDAGEAKKDALSADAHNTALQEFIERAGGAYFEACHRIARTINHLKGRRKKR